MKFKRILPLLFAALIGPFIMNAQVTTSSMTGVVVNENNEPLVGATVTAVQVNTGSRYVTVTSGGGRFTMPNIAPGGPYTLTASFTGLTSFERSNIMVPLGDKYDIAIQLVQSAKELESVTVTGRRAAVQKTGASTNISNRMITTIPNTSRGLVGLTKLTPQSDGTSFAGMNGRYNNITIDGSLFNNNFGRSGDGLVPGGSASAISLDAIDQVQVNIAPFDVRQAGFVGGGINAVTKRGTNNFYATAYGFFKNQDLNGTKVKGVTVDNPKRSSKVYGASLGGAIIKNKLFFFINGEKEISTRPGPIWVANDGTNASNPLVTPVLASDLDKLSTFLKTKYNIETGPYQNYTFGVDNYKVLGRLDWNISDRHRLTLRYTQSRTNDDDVVNNSSSIGSRISNGRKGGKIGGMAYQSSNFLNNTEVKSGVFELNSTFSNKISNQLIASYTDNRPKRIPNSDAAFVDIMRDPSNVYISFGRDLFSYQNFIVDKAINAAENVTLSLGKHNVTIGGSFDHLEFQNSFTSGSGGSYYRYASLQDFLDQKAPVVFAVSYDPNNPKSIKVPSAKFNQLGIYAQDVWSASTNFKLTYGVRVDKPSYPYKPDQNPALAAVTFQNGETFDVSKFPESKLLISPRVGFNYDPVGDKSVIIRGGTGVFTGRIPFIWLVNQVGDNGVVRAQYQASGADLASIVYNPDRSTYIPATVPPAGTTIPNNSNYSATVRDFKMPQVWRTNIAFDKRIAPSTVLTFEGIYTKMIHNVFYRNANLGNQTGTLGGGIDNRPIYNSRLNSNINYMSVLDNTKKGGSLALTAMIQKSFSKGWEASLAYTYTAAFDVAIGSSDQASSGWTTNNTGGNPNDPELGYSNYGIPHRVVGFFSYKLSYLNNSMATTFGLYYSGSSQERFSYRYGGDINGDGNFNDIIYVPNGPSEIKFVEGYKVGSNIYTAKQQSDAFFNFVDNDKYLRKYKGQIMARYGATLPWVNKLDLRILQDFSLKMGSKKHTMQISADITNLLNLINSDWGYQYSYNFGSYQDQALLGLPSSSNNTGAESFNKANPKFTFDPAGPTKVYQPYYSTGSTWGVQLGLRYIFQ